MVDPKTESDLLRLREILPRLWWNIYQGCIDAGFKEPHAMLMTQTYVMASVSNNISPPGTFDGPKTDNPDG